MPRSPRLAHKAPVMRICMQATTTDMYRLKRSAPRCLSNFGVFLGDAETIVSSLWLSHPFALQEETTKFSDQLIAAFFRVAWVAGGGADAPHSPASAPRALLQLSSLDTHRITSRQFL